MPQFLSLEFFEKIGTASFLFLHISGKLLLTCFVFSYGFDLQVLRDRLDKTSCNRWIQA